MLTAMEAKERSAGGRNPGSDYSVLNRWERVEVVWGSGD